MDNTDTLPLTGATRLNIIIGDPIAQVKSPGGMTAAFAERGHDGIVVPVHITSPDLDLFMDAAGRIKNLDGIIVTIPHKFACAKYCKSVTDRVRFLDTVNIMRRREDGLWHGDTVDGIGFVKAVCANGGTPKGSKALLVGAGGAGSAIALALLEAGVRELAVHDGDTARRDALIERVRAHGGAQISAGSPIPTGFDLIANATPAGMKPGDALPIDVSLLSPSSFVGCVVTSPAITPLIAAARRVGCRTSTGTDMYMALQGAMVDFLLADTDKP